MATVENMSNDSKANRESAIRAIANVAAQQIGGDPQEIEAAIRQAVNGPHIAFTMRVPDPETFRRIGEDAAKAAGKVVGDMARGIQSIQAGQLNYKTERGVNRSVDLTGAKVSIGSEPAHNPGKTEKARRIVGVDFAMPGSVSVVSIESEAAAELGEVNALLHSEIKGLNDALEAQIQRTRKARQQRDENKDMIQRLDTERAFWKEQVAVIQKEADSLRLSLEGVSRDAAARVSKHNATAKQNEELREQAEQFRLDAIAARNELSAVRMFTERQINEERERYNVAGYEALKRKYNNEIAEHHKTQTALEQEMRRSSSLLSSNHNQAVQLSEVRAALSLTTRERDVYRAERDEMIGRNVFQQIAELETQIAGLKTNATIYEGIAEEVKRQSVEVSRLLANERQKTTDLQGKIAELISEDQRSQRYRDLEATKQARDDYQDALIATRNLLGNFTEAFVTTRKMLRTLQEGEFLQYQGRDYVESIYRMLGKALEEA